MYYKMSILNQEKNALIDYVYAVHHRYKQKAADIANFSQNYYTNLRIKYREYPSVATLLYNPAIGQKYNQTIFSLFSDFNRRYTHHEFQLRNKINSIQNLNQLSNFRFFDVFKYKEEFTHHNKDLYKYAELFRDNVLQYIFDNEKSVVDIVIKGNKFVGSDKENLLKILKSFNPNSIFENNFVNCKELLEIEKFTITTYYNVYSNIYLRESYNELRKIEEMIIEFKKDNLVKDLTKKLEIEYAEYQHIINEGVLYNVNVYTNWLKNSANIEEAIKNRQKIFSKNTVNENINRHKELVENITETLEKYINKYKFIIDRNKLFSTCDLQAEMVKLSLQGDEESEEESEEESGSESGSESESEFIVKTMF